jgi:YD repeat-containing protein
MLRLRGVVKLWSDSRFTARCPSIVALALLGVILFSGNPSRSLAQVAKINANSGPGKVSQQPPVIARNNLTRSDASSGSTTGISGIWSGEFTQPNGPLADVFEYQLSIEEDAGGAVSGTAYIQDQPYYGLFPLYGQVSDGIFNYRLGGAESSNLPFGYYWCNETVQLNVSSSNLSGTWQSSNCSANTGTINLNYSTALTLGSPTGQFCPCDFNSASSTASGSTIPTSGGLSTPDGGQDGGTDPINIATGNVYEHFTDYQTTGQNPLGLTRYYNSMAVAATSATELGSHWRTNFDRFLYFNSATSVYAERPDGSQVWFTLIAGAWQTDANEDYALTESDSTWTLNGHDDTAETYTAHGKVGRLLSVKWRNGYTQTLGYNGAGELTSVADSYDRKLEFAYVGGLLDTVTTPDGLVLTYGYDSSTASSPSNRLASVTYSTTPETKQSFKYEDTAFPFALTSLIDENGASYATWTYDPYGRGTSSQHGDGASLTQVAYNDATGVHTVSGPLGQIEEYLFVGPINGIPKALTITRITTDPFSFATRTFGYDANGYMASMNDWNGNTTTYTNDTHGQPLSIVEATGSAVTRISTITYLNNYHLPSTIVTPGLTTTFTYDDEGNLLSKELADTTTQTTPYSTGGKIRKWAYKWSDSLLNSIETPNGHATTLSYDDSGALIQVLNALGQKTSIIKHSPGGQPETIVDANGVTTTLTYDPRRFLATSAVSTTAGVLTTKLTRDAAENLLSVTLPDASTLNYQYDSAHRVTQVSDSLGERVALTLDALGDQTSAKTYDKSGTERRQHSATFDSLGRMLTDVGGVGQTTRFTYDGNGNLITSIDPLSHETTQIFDALNRVASVTDANAGVTSGSYDPHDRPLQVTDANANATRYVYDGFGDRISQMSPDSGTTVYHYDADGNLTQKVDAAGVATDRTFDALDRPLTTTYPADPAENVTFTYDQAAHGFGIGRLTSVTDAVGTLSRSYDERGNLLSEKRSHGSVTMTTSYSYNAASRVASITYPSGNKVTYSRDVAGQVTKIATPTTTVASGIVHLPFGPVNGFTFGNGVTDARSFDDDYRMIGLKDTASSTSAIQSLAYAYDLADNLKTITDSVHTANSQAIGYDALNRLTSATAGDYGTFLYTYDKVGNRLTEGRTDGAPTDDYNYVAGTNRLSGLSIGGTTVQAFTYTPTGNIVDFRGAGEPTVSLLYNKANRVGTIAENGTQIAGYTYDGFGQRLVKTFTGTPAAGTLFAYAQDGGLLEETNVGGAAQADYIYLDGTPIGDLAPASNTLYYLHTDHLGTPQLATNSGKATVWQATYEPFGWGNSVSGTITQNLRLPGQYFDSETTSYHNGFRDYVAILG